MFLRDCWYIAAMSDEVGRILMQRWLLGDPVLLYRSEAGTPIALHDVCPHRSMPLSRGRLEGDEVECLYHGLRFDAEGACTRIPGQANIPPRCRVRTFTVIEKWGWIWIWAGKPEEADETLLPDFHYNDDPDWIPTGGLFHINCNYQLLVDNLLDLSHETFVHPTTIGNAAVAETPVNTSAEGDSVFVRRQIKGHPAPPLYVKLKGFTGEIDRTQNIEWTPPSNIVIESRSFPSGSNDPDMVLEYRVLNGITPATETSVHHFWAVPRNFAPEHEVTKAFHEGSVAAFTEDVEVLEEQQAMINAQGSTLRWVDIYADQGGILARRQLAQLLKRQDGGSRLAT